jgi:hypothetical protein
MRCTREKDAKGRGLRNEDGIVGRERYPFMKAKPTHFLELPDPKQDYLNGVLSLWACRYLGRGKLVEMESMRRWRKTGAHVVRLYGPYSVVLYM